MNKLRKKYNRQTGGYKIDIYHKGDYVCSTDWSKTCKEAKEKFLNSPTRVKYDPKDIVALFDKM